VVETLGRSSIRRTQCGRDVRIRRHAVLEAHVCGIERRRATSGWRLLSSYAVARDQSKRGGNTITAY